MSAFGPEVPYDKFHVPLTIIPSEDFPLDINSPELSDHHELFRQRSKYSSLGGKAMRAARILIVQNEVHNQGKKAVHRFFGESLGPSEAEDRLRVILLSLAEYYPFQGIDLWSGEPIVRDIEDEEIAILRRPHPETGRSQNLIHYDSEIRRFFWQFVMGQDMARMDPELLGRLAKDSRTRHIKDIGHEMLEAMVAVAMSSVEEPYTEARNNGQLGETAPVHPSDLVLGILGNTERKDKMILKLRDRIRDRDRAGELALKAA